VAAGAEVNVRPGEADELRNAQPGADGEQEQGGHPVAISRRQGWHAICIVICVTLVGTSADPGDVGECDCLAGVINHVGGQAS
jgi:hypothetical protein